LTGAASGYSLMDVMKSSFAVTLAATCAFSVSLLLGQAPKAPPVAAPKADQPALQASYGLIDPSILQRAGLRKPELGKAPPAPRLPDGKPDLAGPWEPNAIGENVNLVGVGVAVPFKPEAKKIYDSRIGELGKADPEARCLPPGVPRMNTTPYPFRFAQTKDYIDILYEGGTHTWRQIFMDGRKHSKFAEELWNGESIGHWEGDTLVVETQGFNDITWIDAAGVPHTKDMKVTERITRLDMDNMEIVHIVDDPALFTKPWGFTTYPRRLKGELLEYVCAENEKDVAHMVGK
jgi:hypothetical protein